MWNTFESMEHVCYRGFKFFCKNWRLKVNQKNNIVLINLAVCSSQ
uniref:Uncharacterized protein n=1 Tax=Rhizophora mucronata TaxID=61149 RepID=A0A2P2QEA2_RHIMU